MVPELQRIEELIRERGGIAHAGEPVSQAEHALQCAWLAEQAGAADSLVTAALLHDLGHLLAAEHATVQHSPTEHGIDDRHQFTALPLLRGLFGPAVVEPIRQHVDAKRYLCASRPDYPARLSADSRRSLALQGGAHDETQARRFIVQPWAVEAVRLRLWDDQAKVANLETPPLPHFLAVATRAMAVSSCTVWSESRCARA